MKIIPLLIVLTLQTPEPGDQIQWYTMKEERHESTPTATLTQIENHLHQRYGNQYRDKDLVTWGHETTHGINSHIRNSQHNKPAFFHPPNIVILLDSPKITIADVAKVVPQSLRGSRYNTYLIQAQKDWNSYPLYIFDEWTAYVNGSLVGLEHQEKAVTDVMVGPLEFSYYALSLCLAIEQKDPQFAQNKQFREFVAYEIKLSYLVYNKGITFPCYRFSTKLKDNFKTSPDAASLRDLAVRWYGKEFYTKYLGN
jgi:hypothetical protein